MRFKILTLLFFVISFCQAQVKYLNRYETERKMNAENYVLIPNSEFGVLLVTPRSTIVSGNKLVDLVFLNNDLESAWEYELYIDKRFDLIGYYAKGRVSYLLFQNQSNNLFTKVVKVNPLSNSIVEYEPKSIVNLEITEFEVIQNTAILGGYVERLPAVFAYDMENDKVKTLSNVYQKNSELIEVKVNSDSVTFNVLASVLTPQRDRTVLVNSYDYVGNALRDYELQIPKDHQLLTAVSSSIINKEQLITGLYAVKTGSYPSGIFVNHVDKMGVQNMTFYNFGQFETFLNHTGKRADKLKEKALKAVRENKDWRFKIDGIFKELIEKDGEFVFTGEFYRPWTMSTNNYQRARDRMMSFNEEDNIARQTIYSNSQFPRRNNEPLTNNILELKYSHSFAFGLDLEGNLLWDGSLKIDETIDTSLSFLGDFIHNEHNTYYAYYHNKLLTVSHLNVKSDTAQYQESLTLPEFGDKLFYEKEDFKSLTWWHGNKFLVQGIQHIKNDDLRKVYFINAVQVDPDFSTTETVDK